MNGWEHRAAERFGAGNIHVWRTPEQRVAYVCEDDLCAFLHVKPMTLRRWIGAAMTWHSATPDTYTLAADVEGILYRWEALEAILSVPGLVASRHRVKVSGIMQSMYGIADHWGYERRHWTPEQKSDWMSQENAHIQSAAAIRQSKIAQDKSANPDKYATLYTAFDRAFAASADYFENPQWRAFAMSKRAIDTTTASLIETTTTR